MFLATFLTFIWALQDVNAFSPSLPHSSTQNALSSNGVIKSKLNFSPGNNQNDEDIGDNAKDSSRSKFIKQLGGSFVVSTGLAGLTQLGLANAAPPGFQRIPTQFIAALGDPKVSTGTNANEWGIWTVDPGPRGVFLRDYTKQLQQKNNVAPAGWNFDKDDWWLEEHGLIMEAPDFPLAPGRYLVTGGRLVTTILTIGADGKSWTLDKGSLYDVTHLPCRSARYTPNTMSSVNGSPLTANQRDFPVTPGAEMPPVEGCNKLDYAVLFVIGKEIV